MWHNCAISRYFRSYVKVNRTYKHYSAIASVLEKPNVGEVTEVKGWVKNLRVQKGLTFADVSDGSCAQRLQIVIPNKLKTDSLTYGSSVQITGKLSRSPRGQLELHAEDVNVLGPCIVLDGYPFNPRTAHPPEYVRQFLHLRSRTNYISAILRVRNSVTKHIHDYFSYKNYLHVHTPILTSNDCEGAGEVFKIQPDNEQTVESMMQKGRDKDSVYFGTKTFLSVSGQLHLEAVCRGMGNVYTLGPTFRAENSRSRLHLSEFYMLEAELAFCDSLETLQATIEDLVKYLFIQTRNSNEADLALIDKENSVPLWIDKKFITLTYDEATSILDKKGITLTEEGINKEQELALVDHCDGVPVFVIRWPKKQKSFYMKECHDNHSKVEALDLLTPITGEVVGGSLREDCYEKLKLKLPSNRLQWYLDLRKFGNIPTGGFGLGLERLLQVEALDLLTPITGEVVGGSLREDCYEKLKLKLPSNRLQWYLDLRKFGNIPTGGFGLGLERLLQVMCGVNNIKDTLPFPRWPHNCDM